jgi:hypothetical protein
MRRMSVAVGTIGLDAVDRVVWTDVFFATE